MGFGAGMVKNKMGNRILLLLGFLRTEVFSIQVIVPQTVRSTALFASVIMRCEDSTSANQQEVLVTWRFKSFCKTPCWSSTPQAALQLAQDPANDCPDRQRTVRTVNQMRGTNDDMLGSEYRERKISIQNNWLMVLFIFGALLLIMLFCIGCCPQKFCCYVRCPCCPQACCCPEKGSFSDGYPTKSTFAWPRLGPRPCPSSSSLPLSPNTTCPITTTVMAASTGGACIAPTRCWTSWRDR
ncbi:immunoglobulin-like domain-containing receptor 1 [Salmo salar]|uniref:immunoglobulin-like domain-containing receptor 1 n=1 Tax=Salmo salar TaxID=8030 RepID=UPI001E6682F2|nr:immunoglobulin-like domain-containing receptor 1 [Salmo salar]